MKLIEQWQGLRGHRSLRGASEITKTTLSSIPFIAAGVISAVVCAAFSGLFSMSESLAFQTLEHHRWYFWFLTPLTFVLGSEMVRLFSPGSGGSGIPQVIAVLHASQDTDPKLQKRMTILTDKFLGWKVLPIKMFVAIVAVMGGGGVGREGPSIQIAAVVFRMTRDIWQKLVGTKLSFYNMIVAGGAGGIAAAFNTPLGGVIFAVEELAKNHVTTFRLGLLEAVVAAGFISQLINGPYLFLGFPTLPSVSAKALLLVLFVSFVCGVAGALFGVLMTKITRWRRTLDRRGLYTVAIGSGLVMAAVIFFGGHVAVGSGREVMRAILFENSELSYLAPVIRFFTPLITAYSGVAGGIFAPALSAGAALGQLVGGLDPTLGNLAPVCGMIAFLTGLTRTPMTSFVLILEMTDRHSAIFAMMLAALFASISARAVDSKSFYEHMADTFLEAELESTTSSGVSSLETPAVT